MRKLMLPQEANPTRDQIREQIRQTVRDAQIAAEEAAKDARQASGRAERQSIVIAPPVPPAPPGVPGTGVAVYRDNMIPPQVEAISIAFFVMIAAIVIGLPIMRALARRIDRGTPKPAALPAEMRAHLDQISHSVDAIAIEVERISEGQRFTTKMLAEKSQRENV